MVGSLRKRLLRASLALLVTVLCGTLAASATAQDVPGGVATSASITLSTAKTSRINFAGDADWFKITLRNANAYRVTTDKPYAAIRIYDAGGRLRVSSRNGQSLVWRTPVTGTFFVAAKGVGAGTGGYTMRVAVEDTSANRATEGRVTVGKPKRGTMLNTGNFDFFGDPVLYPPDEDWYRVSLTPGFYLVEVTIDVDVVERLSVRNATGGIVAITSCLSLAGCIGEDGLFTTIETAGTYYVALSHGPAGRTRDANYTLAVTRCDDNGAVCD
jgi:hypothetical protein